MANDSDDAKSMGGSRPSEAGSRSKNQATGGITVAKSEHRSSEPVKVQLIHAQVLGAAMTVILGGLVYLNFLMFESYLDTIFWAFLVAQALHSRKVALANWFKNCRRTETVLDKVMWRICQSNVVFRTIASGIQQLASSALPAASIKVNAENDTSKEGSEGGDESEESSRTFIETLVEYAPTSLLLSLCFFAVCDLAPAGMTTVITITCGILILYPLRVYIYRAFIFLFECIGWTDDGAATALLLPLTMVTIGVIMSLLGALATRDALGGLSHAYGSAAVNLGNLGSQIEQIDMSNVRNITSSSLETAYGYVQDNYNDTEWYPIARDAYQSIEAGKDTDDIIRVIRNTSCAVYGSEWWWEYVEKASDMLENLRGGKESKPSSASMVLAPIPNTTSPAEANAPKGGGSEKAKSSTTTNGKGGAKEAAREEEEGEEGILDSLGLGFFNEMSPDDLSEQMSTAYGYLESYRTEIMEWGTKAAQALMDHSKGVANLVLGMLSSIGTFLAHVSGSLTKILLIYYFLNLIMGSDEDYLDKITRLFLPDLETDTSDGERKPMSLSEKIRMRIESVIWVPIEIACLNATLTLITFQALRFSFPYLACLIALLLSLIHLLNNNAYLFILPWLVNDLLGATSTTQMSQWELAVDVFRCVALFMIHFMGYSIIRGAVIEKWRRVNVSGLLTDLSMGLGAVTFGLKGVILGPLLTGLFQLFFSELTE